MNREEVLRKSQAEKQDEGKDFIFSFGRKTGVVGMMCIFIILSAYYLYTGNKGANFPAVSYYIRLFSI